MQPSDRLTSRSKAIILTLRPRGSAANVALHSHSPNGRDGRTHQTFAAPRVAQSSSSARSIPHFDLRSKINRLWAKGKAEGSANTLGLAEAVSMFRIQLGRAWSKFWRSPGELPFCKRTADMLVSIARLIGLSEHTFAHLPCGWTILDTLSRLEHDILDRLVRDGEVHPELTGVQAKALVRRRGKPRPRKKKRPSVKARYGELAIFVDATLDEWSLTQLELAASKLRRLLQRLDSKLATSPRTCRRAICKTISPTVKIQKQPLENNYDNKVMSHLRTSETILK